MSAMVLPPRTRESLVEAMGSVAICNGRHFV